MLVSCYKLSADRRHWRVLSNSSCSSCSTVMMETPSPLRKSAHVPKTQQFHYHPSQNRKGLKRTLPIRSQQPCSPQPKGGNNQTNEWLSWKIPVNPCDGASRGETSGTCWKWMAFEDIMAEWMSLNANHMSHGFVAVADSEGTSTETGRALAVAWEEKMWKGCWGFLQGAGMPWNSIRVDSIGGVQMSQDCAC